ncbi:MAG: hypothetical protein LBJ72_14490 [Dysgonamonadaceae bacterium]|jgi:hypothetical protein|nr:hypothetical protein [Dysgonamonadaceae bacterium]
MKTLRKLSLKAMETDLQALKNPEKILGGDDITYFSDGWKLVNTLNGYYYIDPNGEVHLPEVVVYAYPGGTRYNNVKEYRDEYQTSGYVTVLNRIVGLVGGIGGDVYNAIFDVYNWEHNNALQWLQNNMEGQSYWVREENGSVKIYDLSGNQIYGHQ